MTSTSRSCPGKLPAESGAMKGRCVLVLDDSELALEVQVMMLERQGFVVRGCLDLDDVASAADDFSPDAVLTDVGLGDVSIEQACRALRESFGDDVPILLLSGRPEDELEQLAEELDVDGWVSKSERQDDLLAKLEGAIHLADSGL